MIKVICDSCGKECGKHNSKIHIPFHIAEPESAGYVAEFSGESFEVSGRGVSFDLCLPCSNRIYKAAFRELKKDKS